jgi:hypothetical protein
LKLRHSPALPSFSTVKKNLDPHFSYLVFERDAKAAADDSLPSAMQSLLKLEEGRAEWQMCTDDGRPDRVLMVVKVAPKAAQALMQELLEFGIPEGVTYYLYNSAV